MTIGFIEKSKTLFFSWRQVAYLPDVKKKLIHILNPIDSVRYTEFAYLLGFFGKTLRNLKVLDVSSPHILAYMLSRYNTVIKTNLDESERKQINETINLKFQREDALALSFTDETFDLTYSISVVEHIYLKYADAIREMLRVTRKGGYMYLTFPVSAKHTEEWLPYPMYPAQEKTEKGYFFQYRFGKEALESLFASLHGVEVVSSGIYWEVSPGAYDKLTAAMRKDLGIGVCNLLRNALLNLYAGFFLLERSPGDFKAGRLFGNMSIILKKE